MDIRTGIYAYLNIAGMYIDTGWLNFKKLPGGFSGLYVGVRNILGHCADCKHDGLCASEPVNDVINSLSEGFFDLVDDAFGGKDIHVKQSELDDRPSVADADVLAVQPGMLPSGQEGIVCVSKEQIEMEKQMNKEARKKKKNKRGLWGRIRRRWDWPWEDDEDDEDENEDEDEEDDDEKVKKNVCTGEDIPA